MEQEHPTQGGVPTDLDADVESWERTPWEFGQRTWTEDFIDRLIAERKALREELERLRKGMTLEELLAHHGLPTPDVTDSDRAEFRVESVVAAIAERDSLRTQLTELEAENAKLCAWQAAAAEELIALRERLNEAIRVAAVLAKELKVACHDTDCIECKAAFTAFAALTEQEKG